MSKLGKFAAACAAVVCAFGVSAAEAGEVIWQGAAGGDWSVGTNWSTGETPTADDDVFLNKGADVVAVAGVAAKSITLTDATLKIGSSADRTAFAAEIAGDLTLNGASKLYVYAKTFSDLSVFANNATAAAAIYANASEVEIGGTLAVNGTSVVYPDNDPVTGSPVFFRTVDFTLASGAKFDAINRGWHWTKGTAPDGVSVRTENGYWTVAFGAGKSFGDAGGAYGGNSRANKTVSGKDYGRAYGFEYAPFLPGSPNGCYSTPGRGSGSICVFATGQVELAGTFDANGKAANMYGGPSGGGIWVVGKSMTFASTLKFQATGASATAYSSAGGGGRVSLGAGLSKTQIDALATDAQPEGLSFGTLQGVSVNVQGGGCTGAKYSYPGTTTIVSDKTVSVPLIITATPAEYEKGSGTMNPDYGFRIYAAESVPTCEAPDGTYPADYDGLRRLVNEGKAVDDTTATRIVTWQWGSEECLVRLVPCGGGRITANGVDYTAAGEAWFATGTELTLTATADAGEEFAKWAGDLPGLTSDEATITLTVDKALTINALFSGLVPQAKTYVGAEGGSWHVAANWDPEGVPSLADDVVVNNGKTVYCNGLALVHSFGQTGGALVIGGATKTVETQTPMTAVYVPWAGFLSVGDVTLSGAALSVGARRPGYTTFGAAIGGDLSISGASKVAFYAAESEQVDFASLWANATKVAVGGAFSVGGTSTVYVESDGLTGAPVKFEVAGDMTIGEKATISAECRGWHWYAYDAGNPDPRMTRQQETYYTLAPGYGVDYSIGGVYGIAGETDSSNRRPAYGYKYAPFLPGSPASADYNGTLARAGGQVWIEASGILTLDGTVTANSKKGGHSAPAGGGIWLAAQKIVAGATAKLTANGGDGGGYGNYSGGTGGRISLAIGVSAEDLAALARGEEPEGLSFSDEITTCSATVAGGYNRTDGNKVKYYAPNGTLTTVLGAVDEFNLTCVSTPLAVVAEGLSYEPEVVRKGETWSRTIGQYGFDPTSGGRVRYECQGWVASNTVEEVAHGDGTTASFEVTSGPITVTWIWGDRRILAHYEANKSDYGEVLVEGAEEPTAAGDIWLPSEGGTVRLTAVAKPDCEFLYWYGDIPYGQATNESLTVQSKSPIGFKPVFRRKAAPTTYTWLVKDGKVGSWEVAENWAPTNVPGLADAVVITNGACAASNYVICASLTLAGKAKLQIAAGASDLLEEDVLEVAGDVALSGTAELQLGKNTTGKRIFAHGRLDVGGDLTLADSARLYVSAGPTNLTTFTHAKGSGWVNVGGAMRVLDSSVVYPSGDAYTGGPVVFWVGELELGENASFNADKRGWSSISGMTPIVIAPGQGWSANVGGGYGGYGWTGAAMYDKVYGKIYGSDVAPIHPGSPMGAEWGMTPGGGIIRIHVRGVATIAGKMTATTDDNFYAGGSGGGIWVTSGEVLRIAPTASFDVSAAKCTGNYASEGGGGRLALGSRVGFALARKMAESGVYEGSGRAKNHVFGLDEFLVRYPDVAVDLADGRGKQTGEHAGTFRYVDATPSGLMLIVR